jgi:NADH:ubiquinone oxidoreductase subunit E
MVSVVENTVPLDAATRDRVVRIAEELKHKEGALMPVLHAVQEALG